ncbi:hypothetical protein CI102_587 [Trichoderma harzianum]|nr:hypothetical protein CI102_587 [Trichoderma harzianum]
MDTITALGVASDILAITEFGLQLLSTSVALKVSSTIEEKDENSAVEDYRRLRLALFNKHASLQRRLLASPLPLLKDELALLELATSSLEDSEVLLETIGDIPKDFPGNRLSSRKTDATNYVDSKLGGRFRPENVKRLSHVVTRHASSILR